MLFMKTKDIKKMVVVGDAREGEDYTTIGQRVITALRLSLLTCEEGSPRLRVFVAGSWKQHMKLFDASVHKRRYIHRAKAPQTSCTSHVHLTTLMHSAAKLHVLSLRRSLRKENV